jgi:hypothetical protein
MVMAREIPKLRPERPFLFMARYAEDQLRRECDIPNTLSGKSVQHRPDRGVGRRGAAGG